MLSSTYSVIDVKAKLINDYSFYGLASDAAFITLIESALEGTKYLYMYPQIGSDSYATIAAKDKGDVSALTEQEEYIYWAEVFIACSVFVENYSAANDSDGSSDSENLSVEGYSSSTSSNSGSSEGKSIAFYWNKGSSYFMNAGYNINSLQRTSSIFGEGPDDTIIEVI